MRRYAPGARALGVAELAGHRFVITADGYASVEPARAQSVHGVLWRLTPRDRVTLDAWENIAGGLYRAEMLPVRSAGRRVAGAGLSGAAGRRGPAEARLYGARDRGGARVGLAGGLYRGPCSAGRRRAARGSGRAQDRRVPVNVDPPCRGPRPGAGRRLSRLRRGRGDRGAASKAGCATAATARSRRCSRGRPTAVEAMIAACRQGPHGARVDRHRRARGPARRSLAQRGQATGVLGAADGVSSRPARSARTAPRTRAAARMSTSAIDTGRPRSARLVTP